MFPSTKAEKIVKLEVASDSDFLYELLRKLADIPGGSEGRKPGIVARILQPLLLSNPLETLTIKDISEGKLHMLYSAVC